MDRIKKGHDKAQGSMPRYFKKEGLPENLKMWRPKKEQHIIDIVPYKAGNVDNICSKGDPTYTLEVWVHMGVGANEESYLCLAQHFEKPCPICEKRNQMRSRNMNGWKDLFPKRRSIYNIHCHDSKAELKKGIQVFELSWHFFEKQLLGIAKQAVRAGSGKISVDPFIDFANVKNGKSIKFELGSKTAAIDGNKVTMPDYSGHGLLDRDYVVPKKIQKQVICLDDLVYVPIYDEVEEAMNSAGGKSDDNDSGDNEDIREELEEMSRKELKKYIKENEIDVRVSSSDDEDDIIEKIIDWYEENEAEDPDDDDDDDDEEEDKFDIDEADKDEILEHLKEKGANKKDLKLLKKKSEKIVRKKAIKILKSLEDEDELECPYDGDFGDDCDSLDECEECELYEECTRASEE